MVHVVGWRLGAHLEINVGPQNRVFKYCGLLGWASLASGADLWSLVDPGLRHCCYVCVPFYGVLKNHILFLDFLKFRLLGSWAKVYWLHLQEILVGRVCI